MADTKKAKVRKAEIAETVKRLRGELGGLTQEQLAERIGSTRAAVSQWEAEQREPTPEGFFRLGLAAKERETRRWFWEKSGFPIQRLLAVAAEEANLPLPKKLAVRLADLPAEIKEEKVKAGMGGAFTPGDVFLLEPAPDEQDPGRFWDQVVLLDFPPGERRGYAADWWPTRLYVGRLRCKFGRQERPRLTYYATIGALNDSGEGWSFGDGSIALERWVHPGLEEKPEPGSERFEAHAEADRLRAEENEQREKATKEAEARRPSYEAPRHPVLFDREIPGLIDLIRLREHAELRARQADEAHLKKAEEEAKIKARESIMFRPYPANALMGTVRILGRVIAWFPARKGQA